jgi:predicted ATP-grasp superfamily ATP-dependent carboligase
VKSPLAIVGASTRAAAASALRAGFQPLAADLFADADLRRIATATRISPYPEGFVDWLRAVEPPAWMYTGALENHPELVDQMAWIAPLWGNPGDVLTRVRSPWELAAVLRTAGLLFPEIRASADGLPEDGSWLTKTYRGASGSGVRELGRAQRAGSEEFSVSAHVCYQKRIAGTPCAGVYVAAEGEATLLGATRQLIGEPWLGAHGFQYAGSIGPWPISETTHSTLIRLGNVLAEQFDLVGLFGVDFILAGEEVWALEVNPRYTASVEIVERFSGVSAIAAHATACGGVSDETGPQRAATREKTRVCGKAILFARHDLIISERFAQQSIEESARRPWPTLADVSPAGTPIEAGRPILTVFAEGDSVGIVERELRERVGEIENKLYLAPGQ